MFPDSLGSYCMSMFCVSKLLTIYLVLLVQSLLHGPRSESKCFSFFVEVNYGTRYFTLVHVVAVYSVHHTAMKYGFWRGFP